MTALLSALLQGKHHLARLLADGSMMSKGKVFPAPERWMEWIIGKNIPVGSAYALDRASHQSRCFLVLEPRMLD